MENINFYSITVNRTNITINAVEIASLSHQRLEFTEGKLLVLLGTFIIGILLGVVLAELAK